MKKNLLTKKLVAWLLLVPFCILLIVFALANRQIVSVQFDPFMSDPALIRPIEAPLFLVVYFMLIIGVVLGGLATWFSQGKQRKQKRHWRSEAKKLQNQQELEKQSSDQNSQLNQHPAIL